MGRKNEAGRSYAGQSQDARVAERRVRLMAAAETLYARGGVGAASVTAVCAEAGLTPRYFYESFASREALLLAVFEEVSGHLAMLVEAAIDPADTTGSGLEAFYATLAAHPQLARIFLVETEHRDEAMRAVGAAVLDRIADAIAPQLTAPLARAGAVGAVLRMARVWLDADVAEPVPAMVALSRRFVAAGG